MTNNFEIHPIQGQILRELLFRPTRRFSELNTGGVSSDQFAFHLKRLADLGLVEKTDDHYGLTATGKEFANRFDTDGTAKIVFERQAKIGACVVGRRDIDGQITYLVQKRLKQPSYGFHGFITGKMRWGETVLETAAREFKEETGLEGALVPMGVEHKIDYDKKTGTLLEDKFFFICKAEHLTGSFVEAFEGGRNAWLTGPEIRKLPDLFDDVLEILDIIEGNSFRLIERKYQVEKY